MDNRKFESLWQDLQTILIKNPSTSSVFNQYRDANHIVDQPEAPLIRIKNLYCYLINRIDTSSVLLVGEAAGPWGCRFSGIPFTGEKQLLDPYFPIHGNRSSKVNPDIVLSQFPPFISKSAEIFWEVMSPYHNQFIVWDAFPLHSHIPDYPFSVRNPTSKETAQFGEALSLIVAYIKPEIVISIGKKAFNELIRQGINSTYIRHPSRGGRNKFIEGILGMFLSQNLART